MKTLGENPTANTLTFYELKIYCASLGTPTVPQPLSTQTSPFACLDFHPLKRHDDIAKLAFHDTLINPPGRQFSPNLAKKLHASATSYNPFW